LVLRKRRYHAAEGHGRSPYNNKGASMHFVSVKDSYGQATIRVDAISAVVDDGGGRTTIYFNGGWHQTEATHDDVMATVNAAIDEQIEDELNADGWIDATPQGSE
jgi:hypothetical protein